jgi:hypothetical protein
MHQTYPTIDRVPKLWQPGPEDLRAKTQRFEDPMCFEAWKMTRRCQGAKMEEIHAQSEPMKIGLSGLGYRGIWFFLKR